jgi:hypothetical protein
MKKKCKRKIWSTTINPITHAISGARVTEDRLLDKLRMRELSAFDSMVKGWGTVEDWRVLVDMMNIAEMMGKSGIGPEVLPYCEEGCQAMTEAARRYQKSMKMGLSGLGINALREICAYHDLQRTSVSRSVYETMITKTANYLRSKGKDVVEIK